MEWLNFDNVIKIIGLIANLAIVGSLIFAGYQTMLNKKSYELANERAEKEKAIELAEVYAKEVLPRLSYIHRVYISIGINDIFSKLNNEDFEKFDVTELEELFTENDLATIQSAWRDVDYYDLLTNQVTLSSEEQASLYFYLTITRIMDLSPRTKIFSMNPNEILRVLEEKCDEIDDTEIDEIIGKIQQLKMNNTNMKRKFEEQKGQLLNTLEYFCMYLNTGVADENVIYQSLHQSFLAVVKVCYYDIARLNKTGKDKYYTNIIELYQHWNNKYTKECIREQKLLDVAAKAQDEVRSTAKTKNSLNKESFFCLR